LVVRGEVAFTFVNKCGGRTSWLREQGLAAGAIEASVRDGVGFGGIGEFGRWGVKEKPQTVNLSFRDGR
jgi:hypothetical protein